MKNIGCRVALVTGASSGIGAQAALLFAQNGYVVYGASRSGRVLGDNGLIRPLLMDVAKAEDVSAGIARIISEQGQIDLLLHAAGNGLYGPLECVSHSDMLTQLDVNFLAAQRLVNGVVPHMRAKGSGLVLFVGSVGGIFAIPFQTPYSCSKAALSIYTQGLRLELKPFGVKAAIVEPGDVMTGFTQARTAIDGPCPKAYKPFMHNAITQMEKDELNGMPPLKVAKALARVASKANPPAQTIVGASYRVFVLLKRLLPYRFVEWLLYKMYMD